MPRMTVRTVMSIIDKGKYEFFSVTFTKRTTGEKRTLTCRRGVRVHLKGGNAAYSFTDKGLLSVWSPSDVGAHGPKDTGYRAIPLENIHEVSVHGRIWQVRGDRIVEAKEGDRL